jgi:hypothetical protein
LEVAGKSLAPKLATLIIAFADTLQKNDLIMQCYL